MASSQPPAENAAEDTSVEQLAGAGAAGTDGEEASTENPGVAEATTAAEEVKAKWPGWPGYSVFRLVVPVLKVGGIIGRKGDLVKKLVEETRARVRVLDGPVSSPDRIVLISGKEEPDATLSPAMDAIIRIFKRVNGLPENDDANAAGAAFCLIRLLVPSIQAISLIGKQGSVVKAIQETTGASVRVNSNGEIPIYANSDERIVELQGEALKVLKALEAVVGHLRRFLVDQSVLPLFEKSYNAPATPLFEKSYGAPATQETQVDSLSNKTLLHSTAHTSAGDQYPVPAKRDSLFLELDNQIDTHITSCRHSLYEKYGLGIRSSTLGLSAEPVVTQIAQSMRVPYAYAEDIIGVQGATIDYIRRSSGAFLSLHEGTVPEEITVEIKGNSSQVQAAQQLIQEFIGGHRGSVSGSYGQVEPTLRPAAYSRLGSNSLYTPSSFSEQTYGSGGYGTSDVGRYSSSFRL